MNEEVRDYDKLQYSLKDVYLIVAKLIVPIIALVLIYARFLNVEATQKQIIKDHKDLELKVDKNNADMYRHVAGKEDELEGRLDRKTSRNEKQIIENKFDIKKNTERIIVLETTD